MGIEVAAFVMAGVSAAANIAKMSAEASAASSREKALELQSKQITLQTQQKTLSNYDVMEKVLQAQEAHMTITGAAFSSPSFNAIQRNTLNIGAKHLKNIDLENELEQENIKTQKQNIKDTLYAQLFGDTVSLAKSAASFSQSMPTTE